MWLHNSHSFQPGPEEGCWNLEVNLVLPPFCTWSVTRLQNLLSQTLDANHSEKELGQRMHFSEPGQQSYCCLQKCIWTKSGFLAPTQVKRPVCNMFNLVHAQGVIFCLDCFLYWTAAYLLLWNASFDKTKRKLYAIPFSREHLKDLFAWKGSNRVRPSSDQYLLMERFPVYW